MSDFVILQIIPGLEGRENRWLIRSVFYPSLSPPPPPPLRPERYEGMSFEAHLSFQYLGWQGGERVFIFKGLLLMGEGFVLNDIYNS